MLTEMLLIICFHSACGHCNIVANRLAALHCSVSPSNNCTLTAPHRTAWMYPRVLSPAGDCTELCGAHFQRLSQMHYLCNKAGGYLLMNGSWMTFCVERWKFVTDIPSKSCLRVQHVLSTQPLGRRAVCSVRSAIWWFSFLSFIENRLSNPLTVLKSFILLSRIHP
jgi:hypothetical protein